MQHENEVVILNKNVKLRYFLILLIVLSLGVVVFYFLTKPTGDVKRKVPPPSDEKSYSQVDYLLELPGKTKILPIFTKLTAKNLPTFKKVRKIDVAPQKEYTFADGRIITAVLEDGTEWIYFVNIRGPGIKTNRGLKVGDDVSLVKEKYGAKPNLIFNIDEHNYDYYYTIKENISGHLLDEEIMFGFCDHKVDEIMYTKIFRITTGENQ